MSDLHHNGNGSTTAVTSAVGVSDVLPHHLAELRKSGLSDATIRAAGIRSESHYGTLAATLNWRKLPKRMSAAIVFPFRRSDGNAGYCRLKFDNPRKVGGKTVKYESPKGQPNEIYLPPGVAELLDRPETELLITEGEKKALKATQHGFSCIGLVGVFGWKEGRSARLLPSLERVAWNGRPVRIVFDSDAIENPEVADAEFRLAKHLSDRGAVVRVARLPGSLNAEGKPLKVGVDDFLVEHGPVALRRLLDEAQEAEPISASEMKADAGSLDPATEAGECLETGKVDGHYRLRFYFGGFMLWSRGRYSDRSMSEIRAYLVRHLNMNYQRLTTTITANVLDQLKAQSLLDSRTELPSWLDGPGAWPVNEILVAKNAMIHLPSLATGADFTMPLTPRFFTSSALDYAFDLNAPKPVNWLAFLDQLWANDSESIDALQEWFGYTLTADTSQQKILMLIGPTRCGKGTIGRINRGLIGIANVAGPTLASLATNFGLWPLLGKTLAIISDARLGRHTDSAVVVERLLSISGEDSLTIDRKNLEPVTTKLPTRLMILTNELPRLGDSSGLSRAIHHVEDDGEFLRSGRHVINHEAVDRVARDSAVGRGRMAPAA